MEKILKLYTYVDGGIGDTPFPNTDNPIEIGEFRYDAKRMGGAPTITTSVNYPSCLDDEWTDNVYAEFNGEKYYLKQTPTSSYDNADTMYKHDITLVSERAALDNVYFFDVVTGDPMDSDKPVSNSTKVVFFGDVREFASRLQASLEYSGLDYTVVVDDEVISEEKLMSFEDQFFSNVLQEIYNVYEVPYYFAGKTIHIGYANDSVPAPTFAYGVDDALLSITKNNANYKIVNRATGTGSSDNIPFYYPNNSPKGEIAVDTTSTGATFTIVDGEAFSNEVGIGDVVVYGSGFARGLSLMVSDDGNKWTSYNGEALPITIANMTPVQKWFLYTFQVDTEGRVKIGGTVTIDSGDTRGFLEFLTFAEINNRHGKQRVSIEDGYIDCGRLDAGSHSLKIGYSFPYLGRVNYTIATTLGTDMASDWYNETQSKETSLAKMGLAYSGTLASGDTITQTLVKYVNTSKFLMPFKYRETDGKERFYNATNDTYEGVTFNNPFVEGKPKEHIIKVDDIKPSIEGMEYNGQRIDMFEAFAYDDDDNDETYEDEEGNVYFKHPYFFAKLKPLGFNLFDHAIEQQPMVISFTSGDCGACSFEIAVDEDTQKNTVQVDENGNVKRDEDGNVLCGSEALNQSVEDFQDIQQDTTDHSVWIALKKEEETYGILMPKAPTKDEQGNEIGGHRPSTEDTFVILGINLPYEYIEAAEKKLEAEIIKYLKENNDEKFTFSISFSRIFFEENATVLNQLSENSKIRIIYDEKPYDLYVSSFSYNMSEGDTLPEIRVELDETLKVSQNALQNAISQVKSELGRAIGNIDIIGASTPYFIRKDADDEARGKINFTKGIKFGEGGKVEVMDNNSAKLTIEYLEVTKKASFTSLEIQEKTHVGGQILVTPASINCGEVEELDDVYRCYFQTKGADGDEIFNQFAIGDQAVCQTYNAWGSVYYWRLVTSIGEDYIDLSKTDCDEDSGIPKAGDKIIQLGNRTDVERQNAIVIAAYGDGSPYIIQYKGINSFEIGDDKVVTKLSSTENIFTGKVHMEMGSDGLGDLQEFVDLQALAGKANTNATNAQNKANTALSVADRAQQSADTANTNALQAEESASAATEKAEEAIGKAEAAQDGLDNMEIGGTNLLRNSGFTGDYLSEQLADEKVLEGAAELYSSPLDHWTTTSSTVLDSTETISGKVANIRSGGISQTLYYKTSIGEDYVLSFKAKGRGNLTYTVGDASGSVALTTTMTFYEVVVTPTISSDTFIIKDANCTIGDLKLEKGNKATSWSASPLDNTSDRAYYQSMKYIQNAFEGATDVLGGLVLTEQIQVGDYDTDKKEWVKMSGGMSGVYESDHDVAFWAGGDFNQAIETVMMYADDPTFQPTEEQLASMAKFVVTHGGKAILNDIILRGIIYAKGGSFGDLKIGKYVNACGQADAEDSVFSELKQIIGDIVYSTVVKMSAGAISSYGSYNTPLECFTGNAAIIDADANIDKNPYKAVMYLRGGNVDAMHIEAGDIKHLSGQYKGLRIPTRVITEDCAVDPNEDSIIIADSTNNPLFVYVPIPSSLLNGAFIEVHNVGNATITLDTDDVGRIHYGGTNSTQRTLEPSKTARLVFSGARNIWYMTIV